MRRHAKATSAGSTSGIGSSRRLFRRALATRGEASDAKGTRAPSRIRLALALCAALLLASVLAAPAQAANRAILAELGAPFGTGVGGALNAVSSVGVNRTGAGGVNTGDVYAAESGNNRISQFSAAGAFVRAWGYDVVSSGQDNTGANEQQAVQVKATKGAFSLSLTTATGAGTLTAGSTIVTGVSNTLGTFKVGDAVTGSPGGFVPVNTTITAVGSGTLTLSNPVAAGKSGTVELKATENTGATGTGNLSTISKEVTGLVTRTGEFAVGKTVTGTGVPVGTTITAVGSGTLTLSFFPTASGSNVVLTATNIPFNASAAELKSALEALPGVGSGGVAVSGGPGNATGSAPYVVTFSGGLFAGNDVAQMTPSEAGLSEGTKTVTVETLVAGGGAEICKAVSSPADVCKGGTSSTVAGGLSPAGLAIDQSTGNVYAYGNAGKRVDAFSAKGIFEGAFGWNVITGGAEGTGTVTSGSTTVESVVTTKKAFLVGQTISGEGIPAATKINAVTTGTGAASKLTLSQAATETKAGDILTVAAGAGNAAGNEQQALTVKATAGTFKLKFKTTSPTAEPTTGATGTGELTSGSPTVSNLLTAKGTANVTSGSSNVTVVTTTVGAFVVGQPLVGTGIPAGATITAVSGSILTISAPATATAAGTAVSSVGPTPFVEGETITGSGIPAGTTIAAVGPGTLTLSAAATENKPATNALTANIPYNAAPSVVQNALAALSNVGSGNVEVSGGPGNETGATPYTVTFKGTRFADTNVSPLETAAGSPPLSGGAATATVETLRDGGALEFCTTSSGCLAGEGSASAGGFANAGITPRNLSVDSGGKIYVPDPGNLRFDVFNPTLNGSGEVTGATFVRGIGWKVVAGTSENKLQECTTLTGCQKGSPGNEAGQFGGEGPTTVAVDPAKNIYTASTGDCATATCRIQKFNPDGTIANASFGPSTGECSTVRTEGFTTGPSGSGVLTVAVDPSTEHVLAYVRVTSSLDKICEFNSSGSEVLSIFPGGSLKVSETSGAGLATGTGERVYAGHGNVLTILGPVPPPAVEILPVSEVGQTTAKLNGKVTVPAPGGEGFNTVYHFEISADGGATWAKVPSADVSVGSTAGTSEVHQTATGLQPNLNYRVRLVATTGPSVTSSEALFKTLAAPPTVGYPPSVAPSVTETTAKLKGFVNPNNSPTTYRFEWGTSTAYGNQAPDFEPFIGSGGEPLTVTANLAGLKPDTTYHYRLVATNTAGPTNGVDRQFTTAEGLQQLNPAGLPDNRRFELVSPPNKRPAGEIRAQLGNSFVKFQTTDDGESVIFPYLDALESDSGGDASYLAERSSAGWQSTKVSPPSLVEAPSAGLLGNASSGRVSYYSRDLSCGVISTFNPLTTDTPPADVELGVENLFRRNSDGSHTLITSSVPANPGLPHEEFGHFITIGASPDCGRIYFASRYHYLPNPSGLYEWDEGALRDAGELHNGATAENNSPEAFDIVTGAGGLNSVSADGSRFFFTAVSNEGFDKTHEAIFVRKNGAPGIDVSQSQTATANTGTTVFRKASADGTHVFFTARPGLASNSAPGAVGNSLYDYNVDTGVLRDLTPDANAADTAGAKVERVLAASEDGSHVYFAAAGQLVPGQGKTYAQNQGAGTANLYLVHGGALAYVATITGQGGNPEATPDGEHLLFASTGNITGYDSGGAPEAYLYSAPSEDTVCVSCRLDGQHSVGNSQTQPLIPSFSASPSFQEHRRKMSEDGSRIFFSMPDVLAPGAVSGNVNLYEWEKGQIYLLVTSPQAVGGEGGATQLYGTSASGNDVFIGTPQQLDPHDTDSVLDLYDLRVGDGFPAPPSPPVPCDVASSECQGPETPQPAGLSPSQSSSGEGNPPLKAPPCRKGKVRKHGKCVPRKHHKKKHRAANTNRGGAR